MNQIKIVKDYLSCLENSDYTNIIKLFSKNAIVNSPLYGKVKAVDYYQKLFRDTNKSIISLQHIFTDNHHPDWAAGHFHYDWILQDGTPTSFECVDVFHFNQFGLIKTLTIIYDTAPLRPAFVSMTNK